MTDDYGLGRLPAADERDLNYPLARLLGAVRPAAPERRYWWANGWWGDQGPHPYCVGYAWTHWLRAGPNTQRQHQPTPAALYRQAQQVDEWPGEDYDGTSVRAGAKVLRAEGYVGSYWWATTVEDVAAAVLTVGPVVVGTVWHTAMFNPSPDDGWRLRPIGSVVGGHAYLLDGYNTRTRLFRVKQSWGRSWGRNGFAALHADDLHRLLADDGEACLALETTPGTSLNT